MEHLNIMSRPIFIENYEEDDDVSEMAGDCFDPKTNAVGIQSYNPKIGDFHIDPCQMKAKSEEKKIEELICPQKWEKTPALCFVFKDKFMPPGVVHRLLDACNRSWEIAEQKNDRKKETLLFNGIGAFKTCKRSQLRLWYIDHIIYARMLFMPKEKQEPEKAIDSCTCQNVRKQLYRHLMAILNLLPRTKHVTKTTPFEEYIQCPLLSKHNHGLFRVNDFIYEGNMICYEDHDVKDAHPIEKETVLQCWYPDAKEEMKKDEENSFGDLNRVLEVHELPEISRGLKEIEEFWLLGIELGISQPTMERLKKDHWKEPRSVFIYHVLYEWKQLERQNATLSNLKRKVFAVQKNSDIELGMQVHWKNDVPTDLQLMKLAGLVGGEWKRLGLELNLTEPKLQQLNVDHHAKGVVIVVYEMLIVWMKRNSRPTLLDLGTCIVRSGVSFDWDSVPEDVLEETRDLGDEAMESSEMDTQTGLDDKKLAMFAKALREGHEEVQRIRAMVVGMFSVGKTSLVNNLIDALKNKRPPLLPIDEKFPASTEGIDVHLCKIENENWKKLALTQKRNIKRALEKSMTNEQYDLVDLGRPVEKQEEKMDVCEQTEENTQVKVSKQPPDNVSVDYEKLKKFVEPDEIEHIPGNPPLVSVWGFAGQNLYYSTHHFFLNKRSIYLLLMSMTIKLENFVEGSESLAGLVHEKFTNLDAFKFWLNSIHMNSSIHDQEHVDKPTVILIGTHKDQMEGTEEEKEEQMNAFFNEALKPFIGTNILKHVHDKKFLVNNLDAKDTVFDEIRNEVKKVAEGQPYWNEKHPLKWIQLEKTFEQMRGDGKEVVTLQEVEAANRENPHPLESAQLQLFLEIQHMYGNILYFNTMELKNHVILSPQWIIEAFKCFINHKEKPVLQKLLKEWQRYKESAILEPQLLQAILANSDPQIRDNAAVVVEYMEHLKIMAKPIHLEDYDEPTEGIVQQVDFSLESDGLRPICEPLHLVSNFYILPCQLKGKPDGEWKEITNPPTLHNTEALCFVFKDNFMPPAIFHRLLAACIRSYEIAKLDRKHMLYNRFGVFKVKQAQLRLWYFDHIIYARMSFFSNDKYRKQAIDRGVCGDVRRVLYRNLMAILGLLPRSKNFKKTTPYDEYVQCPKLNEHNCGLFRVNSLLTEGEMNCIDDHKEGIPPHTMKGDKHLWNWYNDVVEQRKKAESTFEGVDLEQVPTDQHLSKIALCMSKTQKIWLIGIELGLGQVDMERIRRDHLQNFTYNVLLEWRKKKNEPLKKLKQVCVAVMKNEPGEIYEIFAALKE